VALRQEVSLAHSRSADLSAWADSEAPGASPVERRVILTCDVARLVQRSSPRGNTGVDTPDFHGSVSII
jgi:hypothetical protein